MSSVNQPPADAVPAGYEPAAVPAPGPAAPAGRRVSFWNAPFRRRTWAELLYGLIGLPIAVFGFAVSVSFVSAGIGTAVTVIGFFVLDRKSVV